MELVLVLAVVMAGAVCGEEPLAHVVETQQSDTENNGLANTKLELAFVIFRHGDRTPDSEELDLYPEAIKDSNIFFPYGKKALTNKGKQRSYFVGKYIRKLYDGFISKLYLNEEITVRTTDYARTQMTALTALSALYPPPPAQKWNPNLDWQPIPYDTPPFHEDDLLYWYNCPRYIWLRNKMYERPEVKQWIEPYQNLFQWLSEKTIRNITTTEDVFFLDNLFQTLKNVNVNPPKWAQDVMTNIKEVTKIEYAIELYNSELIKLAAGVLMQSIMNTTRSAIEGISVPKLHLYSAHENNVAALMAAAKVFKPHQPNYGATFSLELRRKTLTGEYGIVAVYARDAGGPGEILPINGCGDQLFCDYDKFVGLVQDVVWSKEEMDEQCVNLT